jgi:hypothetical protein
MIVFLAFFQVKSAAIFKKFEFRIQGIFFYSSKDFSPVTSIFPEFLNIFHRHYRLFVMSHGKRRAGFGMKGFTLVKEFFGLI